ncbi:MAG: GNAT family N-acetyltransferase [Yoonia sp.]|uniref:GNAT family N-acetyltransferase n=1 Tax=Yoonia sp. TaxID=2212373 RepID=UPI003EF1A019
MLGQAGQMEVRLRAFRPDDAAWLVDQHAAHYTSVEGFDESFAPLVAEIIAAFLRDHDPRCEAGWIATEGDRRIGSIFCVRLDENKAKLRLFYVIDAARGTGVAQALLTRCLEFARAGGYTDMTLWTHESHKAAGAIYARNGFVKTASVPTHSFGVDLVEETWEIRL